MIRASGVLSFAVLFTKSCRVWIKEDESSTSTLVMVLFSSEDAPSPRETAVEDEDDDKNAILDFPGIGGSLTDECPGRLLP